MASAYVKPLSDILTRYKRLSKHINAMIGTLNSGIRAEREMIDNGNDLSETQGAMHDLFTVMNDYNTQAQNMLVDLLTLHEYQVRMKIGTPFEVYQYALDADGAGPGATFTATDQGGTVVADAFEGLGISDKVYISGLTTSGNDGEYTVAAVIPGQTLTLTADLPVNTDETITAATHPDFKIELVYDNAVPV